MALFNVNTNADEVKDRQGGSGNYIGAKSGMFPVKIKHAIVNDNGKGAIHINLVVDYEGNSTTIYRAFPLSNNDGKENVIGREAFNEFCIVCGIKGSLDPVMKDIPLGKDNVVTEVAVFEEFEEQEVMLHIKRRFSWYSVKNTVTQNTIITKAFRIEDNASASEIVNNSEVGKQFEYELKNADKDRIDKDVTQEMVDEFLASKGSNKDTKEETKDNKPASGFGSRFSK